jgi:hypothetical protein
MHALNRVTGVTGDLTYNRQALELAKKASAAFVYRPFSGTEKRMYWKMSTDLAYPLVPSMGLHDPLDGLTTYTQLHVAAAKDHDPLKPDLSAEIADLADMCRERNWTSDDPLGIGGLLSDALRAGQLMTKGAFAGTDLLSDLLEASLAGLYAFAREDTLKLPPNYRLAFRELGLSIGLRAAERLPGLIERNQTTFSKGRELKALIKALKPYEALAPVIERFWLEPEHQKAGTWIDHREINMVMLATSLAPGGYVTL